MDSLKLNDLFGNSLTSKCLLDSLSDILRLFIRVEMIEIRL